MIEARIATDLHSIVIDCSVIRLQLSAAAISFDSFCSCSCCFFYHSLALVSFLWLLVLGVSFLSSFLSLRLNREQTNRDETILVNRKTMAEKPSRNAPSTSTKTATTLMAYAHLEIDNSSTCVPR